MSDPEIRSERTLALFLLGMVALSPPLLAIFATDAFVFGVPLLYGYLFGVWVAMIALLALVSASGRRPVEDLAETALPGSPAGAENREH